MQTDIRPLILQLKPLSRDGNPCFNLVSWKSNLKYLHCSWLVRAVIISRDFHENRQMSYLTQLQEYPPYFLNHYCPLFTLFKEFMYRLHSCLPCYWLYVCITRINYGYGLQIGNGLTGDINSKQLISKVILHGLGNVLDIVTLPRHVIILLCSISIW